MDWPSFDFAHVIKTFVFNKTQKVYSYFWQLAAIPFKNTGNSHHICKLSQMAAYFLPSRATCKLFYFFTTDCVILLNNTLTCTTRLCILNTPIFIQRYQKYNTIIPALTSTTNNQNYAPLTTYSVNVYQHTINLVYYFQVIIQSKLGQ